MTQRFYITKNLDVFEFEAEKEWGYPRHKHHFFELTFVLKGSGKHVLNESVIDYKEGDLFFLTPKDEHEFIIGEPTKFGVVKFTEQMFLEKATFSKSTYLRKNLEAVIFHRNIVAKSVISCETDKEQLFRLYHLIKSELHSPLTYSRNVLSELFGALLIILSRNLKSTLKNSGHVYDKNKVDLILTYIRQNVQNKELIKVDVIAENFHLSPNYVGIFVKKHTGISLQRYIMETKIKIAENLLKQSSLSIGEIAEKTGFTDSSHFNKTFKKYTGKNPSEYQGDK